MTTEVSYRYLTQVPGVRSGAPLVAGTRIGVHDVMGLIVNGASVDDVVRGFPELTRAQVYECLAYDEDHREQEKTEATESSGLSVISVLSCSKLHEAVQIARSLRTICTVAVQRGGTGGR